MIKIFALYSSDPDSISNTTYSLQAPRSNLRTYWTWTKNTSAPHKNTGETFLNVKIFIFLY